MHANRNKKAVKRVEKGMMKANRIRNLFAVFAIVLTTFMITTVFSLGINYMLISLKTPIFLPICTGCHQKRLKSDRKRQRCDKMQ